MPEIVTFNCKSNTIWVVCNTQIQILLKLLRFLVIDYNTFNLVL